MLVEEVVSTAGGMLRQNRTVESGMTARPMKKQKVTLLFTPDIAGEVQRAVECGLARSQSALVEEAVVAHLARIRQRALAEAYVAAAGDEAFLADIERVNHDFLWADSDPELKLKAR